MKLIVPDYYRDFQCIAGACRHSCCVGWEIGVDDETMEYYRSVPGEIGEKLRENIDETDEGACFHLREGDRCPFLDENGLCELILTMGEGALCQICDDHPRFRNFFSDRTEMGLGLCCEAAGKLILGHEQAVSLTEWEDDGEEEALTDEEATLLELRDRLTRIIQDRRYSVWDRAQRMLDEADIRMGEIDFIRWAEVLKELERLDEAWTERLNGLKAGTDTRPDSRWDTAWEQLMVYLLFRHLPGALEDDRERERIAYVYIMARILERMFAAGGKEQLDELIEIARLYSSEIEYSDENGEAILEEIARQLNGG